MGEGRGDFPGRMSLCDRETEEREGRVTSRAVQEELRQTSASCSAVRRGSGGVCARWIQHEC